jgi:hypothetical protein
MLSLHDKTRKFVCGVGVLLVSKVLQSIAAVAGVACISTCCCRRCSCIADMLGRVLEGRKDEGHKESRRSVRVGA